VEEWRRIHAFQDSIFNIDGVRMIYDLDPAHLSNLEISLPSLSLTSRFLQIGVESDYSLLIPTAPVPLSSVSL